MSKKGYHQYPQLMDRDWLYQKYRIEYWNSHQIGKLLCCSHTMVIDSLRRCNIRIRTPSEAKGGKLNPNYGKIATERAKQKLSDLRKGENNPFYGKLHTERTRRKWSEARKGENNPSWQGGISFEPYCQNFNGKFKEYIREKFNRSCFLCDTTEEENGR